MAGWWAETFAQAVAQLRAARATFVGSYPLIGGVAAAAKPATAVLSGIMPADGAVAATAQPVVAALAGETPVQGVVGAAASPAVFTGVGVHAQEGAAAALLQPVTSALAGEHIQQGLAASLMQPILAAGVGAQTQAGTVASAAKAATAALAGAQPFTGAMASQMIPATAAFAGVQHVAFDAVGAGSIGSGTSRSESHTIAGNAILAFTGIQCAAGTRPTITMTVGGQAMTELATVAYYTDGSTFAHHLTVFGKLNPLTGAQTVAATYGAAVFATLNSVSYKQVASFGTAVTGNALNGSATLTVTSAVGQMIAQAFSGYTTTFTAYNRSSRWNQVFVGSSNMAAVIGDAAGASSVGFTASTGTAWGGVGVPLIP